MKDASFKEQVTQLDFWLVIMFLAVQSLRVSMYVGTMNDRFEDGIISFSPSSDLSLYHNVPYRASMYLTFLTV